MQPLTYAYNVKEHWSMNFTPLSPVLSHHPPGPTTFNSPTASPADARATTTLHAFQPLLLHRVAKMRQYAEKRIRSWQRLYKYCHDLKVFNVPLLVTVGQYIYLDCPPITTSATERLATGSYKKVMSPKTWPFKVIEVSPTTISTKEDGVRNTVSVD